MKITAFFQRSSLIVVTFSFVTSAAVAQATDADVFTGLLFETEEEHAALTPTPTYRSFLPEKVDLSGRMPKVGNQGRQGSCVGWAVGYAARSYYRSASEGQNVSALRNRVSPAYIYNSIRDKHCNSGSRIVDALKLLKNGALSLSDYSYSDSSCPRPTKAQVSRANGQFRLKGYRSVDVSKLDQVRGSLAKGHPVIVGAWVDRAFNRLGRGRTWTTTKPRAKGDGSHAITIVGYNDRRKQFKFVNSWGTRWGSRGYGTVTYDAFKARVQYGYQMIPLVEPVIPVTDPDVVPPSPPKPSPTPVPPAPVVDLPKYECSSLSMSSNGKTIEGFISKLEDMSDLKSKLADKFSIGAQLRPWPQCEALLIIAPRAGQGSGKGLEPNLEVDKTNYAEGDLLKIKVVTPAISTHLHLTYFQADGSVVHLSQSAGGSLKTLAPNTTLIFGDGEEGRAQFNVQAPFGNEMALAITTKSPLFQRERPQVETEREFLSALRAATIELRQKGIERTYTSANAAIITMQK